VSKVSAEKIQTVGKSVMAKYSEKVMILREAIAVAHGRLHFEVLDKLPEDDPLGDVVMDIMRTMIREFSKTTIYEDYQNE
jgi:hypothetical protein